MTNYLFLFLSLIAFVACNPKIKVEELNTANASADGDFNKSYWEDGKAEIAVYDLVQNRYNGLHPGKLVSVFVLEDFITDKHVKNERYISKSSTQVLKNIRVSKFTTGIYDYSLHSTVFTPLNQKQFPTLKVVNTMQEWCGSTFLQLNYENDVYNAQQRSYFEAEGDRQLVIPSAVIEDALMNQIRLDYKALPLGPFPIIPRLEYIALKHKDLVSVQAEGSVSIYSENDFSGEYLLKYIYRVKSQSRVVELVFEKAAPHTIVGFKESYPSAFDGEIRTTTATLNSSERLAYWGMNSPKDAEIRNKIGL
jgi:hypothetical protein